MEMKGFADSDSDSENEQG
uniref:Uncharacterized protein n=1 Tax=Rhizophora mucronata TaxID=61149 RepID=A0A2P2K0Y2_RHIMU